ncbi:hypothetical protein FisN_6Hh423 [Fistulifera solaris]|uniref:Protein kinase domain-containing protein n=1 Tax=Fistulifera solaris TaxID=1519565 RepID=A0A1Z5K5H8_FISSO|nr:hypothetical protein FisN_6Hh423 [Fistulifera solaris]|eukprot:GAX21533.1 hypothetical protein FisN_6Hh423 [Fistulifera solaris]
MRLTAFTAAVIQALPAVHSFGVHRNSAFSSFRLYQQPEWSDFDDFVGDETANLSSFFASRPPDNSACSTRQFSLGADLILSDFVGNMGFEEVTDWEYYYQDDDQSNRKVVQPNPFDKSKPKRTRTSSGSVVRIFRAEFVGQLGGILRAQGLDQRCIIKEFSGNLALELAQKETESLGRVQSLLLAKDKAYQQGEWTKIASARSVQLRQDNANVATLLQELKQYPFVGMLGEVNLAELDDEWDPNEFYRALGVKPPSPDAIWLVYEYAGLSTIQAYAKPAVIKRSKLPPSRGFFGNVIEPPALPPFAERADFVVKGIIKGAIEAVAQLHEAGLVHRSIGRTSIYLSSTTQDKTEAVSVFNTRRQILRVKVADLGFSGLYKDSTQSEEFCARARTFGLSFRKGDNNVATANFSIAEDMHALGFVILALLLNSLAELPNPNFQMPNTDEDTLQRLLGEIFEKDMDQFREYVEAEDIWTDLVQLLDENDRAGWKVLETLMLAREKASKNKDTQQLFSIRGLLNSPFFA